MNIVYKENICYIGRYYEKMNIEWRRSGVLRGQFTLLIGWSNKYVWINKCLWNNIYLFNEWMNIFYSIWSAILYILKLGLVK